VGLGLGGITAVIAGALTVTGVVLKYVFRPAKEKRDTARLKTEKELSKFKKKVKRRRKKQQK